MIDAEHLVFGYQARRPVLADWHGSIGAGETVALVGPSGCGKSTLLYILGTLVRPWAGTIKIGGRDVARLGDRARSDVRAASIGFVFQDAVLDGRRSILDNIIEGSIYRGDNRRDSTVRARSLLEEFDVIVEPWRKAVALSGGQAQRVALCRALMNEPSVLLADEPTGNLDKDNAAVVERALFDRARSGAAVVIATHDEALAGRCDRTLHL